MNNEEDRAEKSLGTSWSHLFLGPDPRSEAERKAAESSEDARRKGRGRSNWWVKDQNAKPKKGERPGDPIYQVPPTPREPES